MAFAYYTLFSFSFSREAEFVVIDGICMHGVFGKLCFKSGLERASGVGFGTHAYGINNAENGQNSGFVTSLFLAEWVGWNE